MGWAANFAVTVIVGILVYLLNKVRRFLWWGYNYFTRLRRAERDIERQFTEAGPREGRGIWVAEPIKPPKLYGNPHIPSPCILVVANAKGGVGKTTVAANLGACFAAGACQKNKKPVLLIDLDFQGSLSSMAVSGGRKNWVENGRDSNATYLISDELDAKSIVNSEHAVVKANGHAVRTEKLQIVTAHHDLAQAENRLMIKWLLSDREDDIRFRLRKVLADDQIRNAFSVIIIDSPPRLTTGAIQALAAGTHLLIPTILDEPSSEAVLTFVRQVEVLKNRGVCPHIQYVGVVATMVDARENINGMETWLKDRLELSEQKGGAGGKIELLPRCTFIPESLKFRDAGGRGIAYNVMGNASDTTKVRAAIRELASEVSQRMALRDGSGVAR